MKEKDEEYKKTNREKSMSASKRKFWCGSCDAQLIGEAKRCPVCGKRSNRKKRKGI